MAETKSVREQLLQRAGDPAPPGEGPDPSPTMPPRLAAGPGLLIGGALIILGLMGVIFPDVSLEVRVGAALALLAPGVLILPPTAIWLRSRHGFPPNTATRVWLVIALAIVGGVFLKLGWPTTPSPKPAQKPPAVSVQAKPVQKPAKPYAIITQGDPMFPAQEALNAGDVDRAIAILDGPTIPVDRRASPEAATLLAAIQAESDRQNGIDRAGDEMARIKDVWQPQLDAIPTAAPASAGELWDRINDLEEVAHELERSSGIALTPAQKGIRSRFKSAIMAKQRVLFPILRKAYGAVVGEALWSNDVDVRVGGPGNRTVTWTAAMFAAHSNIGDAQGGAQLNLLKMRFTHSAYRWAAGIGEVNTYTMSPPSDESIGYWEGSEFKKVE